MTNKEAFAEQWIKDIKERMTLEGTGLLKLLDYSVKTESSFCAKNHKVREYWQAVHGNLAEEIAKREGDSSGFNDQELTYILFNATHAAAAMNDKKYTHNEITPLYISETGERSNDYKLVDRRDKDEELPQIIYNQMASGKELFLAPELFENSKKLNQKDSPAIFDEKKCDAFSLGMTILRAGTMNSLQDCYDEENYEFNEEALANHIKDFSAQFSENPLLCESLVQLLETNPENRWNLQYLRSELPPLQEIREYYNDDEPNTTGGIAINNITAPVARVASSNTTPIYSSTTQHTVPVVTRVSPVTTSTSNYTPIQTSSVIHRTSYTPSTTQYAPNVVARASSRRVIPHNNAIYTTGVRSPSNYNYVSSGGVRRSPSQPVVNKISTTPVSIPIRTNTVYGRSSLGGSNRGSNPLQKRYFGKGTSAKNNLGGSAVGLKINPPEVQKVAVNHTSSTQQINTRQPIRSTWNPTKPTTTTNYTNGSRIYTSPGTNTNVISSRRVISSSSRPTQSIERRTYSSNPSTTRVISSSSRNIAGTTGTYKPVTTSTTGYSSVIRRSNYTPSTSYPYSGSSIAYGSKIQYNSQAPKTVIGSGSGKVVSSRTLNLSDSQPKFGNPQTTTTSGRTYVVKTTPHAKTTAPVTANLKFADSGKDKTETKKPDGGDDKQN